MMCGRRAEFSGGFVVALIVIISMLHPCIAKGQTDLIVDATTVYLYGEHEYRDVRIVSGGILSITQPVGFPYNRGKISIECRTFIIDASSKIDGFGQGDDWGRLQTNLVGGSGGSYGGRGGNAWNDPPYGSIRGLDIDVGHGGATTNISAFMGYGGRGGGCVRVQSERLQIEGTINVNGEPGHAAPSCPPRICPEGIGVGGSGAGGGVLLLAKNIILGSNAKITANGASGTPGWSGDFMQDGFGGGGGRIKIFYETGEIAPSAVISASQGLSNAINNEFSPCTTCFQAEPGTIWIQQVPSIERLLHPSGDLNNDGIIDATDATILMSHWHEVDPTVTPWMTWTPHPTWTPRNTNTPVFTRTPTTTPSATPGMIGNAY